MLKISEIKKVLRHIIQNNQYLEQNGKKKNAILVEGEAGLGKTSIMMQLANEFGLRFVKINLAQIEQAGDLLGYPLISRKTKDGKWLTDKEIELTKDVELTGEIRTTYAKPDWVPTDDNGVILILDDFTRAPTHIMQAVMEIIDRGEYVSWKLPKNSHVFLTSNPCENGDYIVTNLDAAQQTRYIRLVMRFDINEWATWAEHEGIDSRCINFLLLNPEMIKQKVNPRLATDYFNSISSIPKFETPDGMELINWLGEGSVGSEFSTTFSIFVNNKLDQIPSPQNIIETETDDGAVNKIKKCVGKIDTVEYKQNIASVIATRLVNYAEKISNEKGFKKKDVVSRYLAILKSGAFSGDINYHLIKSLNAKRQFSSLIEDNEIRKIVTK